MGEGKREELKVAAKRGVLVAVITPSQLSHVDSVLDEIRGLAETAGVEVVGEMIQSRAKPSPATYLGSGKLVELHDLMEAVDAEIAVFDNTLSPSQGKNIEEAIDHVVVDRSEVILDIFATHAQTDESRLQVELAQLLYMRPRLMRMWTHLERIEGGIGSGRGPGEKQLETDRRLIDKRISELKRKLKVVEKRRSRIVSSRKELPTVSLVGYTNAGKSTLMHALTGADVYIADQLFATLDTRTRRWTLPNWGDVLLSDTVGFIKNLPHHLVASFRSTLEEARHAELLLHVVDASDPEAEEQIKTVDSVLASLGIENAETFLVLNKIDAIKDRSYVDVLRAEHPQTISVSAIDGTGIKKLSEVVAEFLGQGFLKISVDADAGDGKLHAFLTTHSEIEKTTYDENRVTYECKITRRYLPYLERLNCSVTKDKLNIDT